MEERLLPPFFLYPRRRPVAGEAVQETSDMVSPEETPPLKPPLLSLVIRLGEQWPGLACLWLPLEGREVDALYVAAALHQGIGGPHIEDHSLARRVRHLWVREPEAAALRGEFWSVLRTLPPGEARLLDLDPPPGVPSEEDTVTVWTASSVKFRVEEPAPWEKRSTVRLEAESLHLLALLWNPRHSLGLCRGIGQPFPSEVLDLLEGKCPLVALAPRWLAYLRNEIGAADLAPLFSHPDPQVRERAIRILPSLFVAD